ncbi:hypothetical protein V8C86DRAFT_2877977, partial [Haematococcus lacustris]
VGKGLAGVSLSCAAVRAAWASGLGVNRHSSTRANAPSPSTLSTCSSLLCISWSWYWSRRVRKPWLTLSSVRTWRQAHDQRCAVMSSESWQPTPPPLPQASARRPDCTTFCGGDAARPGGRGPDPWCAALNTELGSAGLRRMGSGGRGPRGLPGGEGVPGGSGGGLARSGMALGCGGRMRQWASGPPAWGLGAAAASSPGWLVAPCGMTLTLAARATAAGDRAADPAPAAAGSCLVACSANREGGLMCC